MSSVILFSYATNWIGCIFIAGYLGQSTDTIYTLRPERPRHADRKQSHGRWCAPEPRVGPRDRKVAPAAGAGKGLALMSLQWTNLSCSPRIPYPGSFPSPHAPPLLPFHRYLSLYTGADSSWMQKSICRRGVGPTSVICPQLY